MGHVHLDDLGAGALERRHRLAHARLHARLQAGREVLARQPEPQAAQGGGRLVVIDRERAKVRNGQRRGGRVTLVPPGDGAQQERRVANVAPEGPHLVER